MNKRPEPGVTVDSRRDLHDAFGGNRQAAISIAGQAGMIHLFADPSAVDKYGLSEGWGNDGCFHLTGAGLRGDQKMTQSNRALLTHKEAGRDLYLWAKDRGAWTCLGQFELDEATPSYLADAPDVDGAMRQVIVFRLRPVAALTTQGPKLAVTPSSEVVVRAVDLEAVNYRHIVGDSLLRSEVELVSLYAHHLAALGHKVEQLRIVPPGERQLMVVDLYDETANVIIECKINTTRGALRNAIGALTDYRRFISPTPRLAVLVPEKPRPDLIELCSSLMIEVIWLNGDQRTFTSSFD
ncbi:restriction endonuclease [Kitasatospora sp. NPDC092039]|uniref:restriction endonuclease n=1 Tax=Kitasatospora sp. NPDC092039 TaxID=3364086 RepID=UPI00382CD843